MTLSDSGAWPASAIHQPPQPRRAAGTTPPRPTLEELMAAAAWRSDRALRRIEEMTQNPDDDAPS